MDFHVMNLIGTTNNDNNLVTAAAAQKMRFYPGGDSADAKVVALDNVYSMMPSMDGLAGFAHVFSMVKGDNMSWGNLGNNPNETLSEYVVAYMGLAVGQNGGQVLKTVQGPSANMGGNICNGTSDGQDPTYMCSESKVDAIATAHCAVAANGKPSADVSSFQSGNYAGVKMGPCGATCPAECGCDTNTMNCVAPWIAMNGGGTSSGSSGGSGATSSTGGGSTGGSSGNGFTPTGNHAGCSCRSAGSDGGPNAPLFAAASTLAALVLVRARRRRAS
jgi:MYXO-CTERM domain-containing protein